MSNPLLSIIIVNYNGKHWLEKCIASIRKQTYKPIEIIIIDDKSSDGSLAYIEKEFPEVKLIDPPKHGGFGISNNIGVDNAKGQELLFLNNDTYFDENFLQEMVEYKRKNQAHIVGPKIKDFEKIDRYKEGMFLSIDVFGYAGWQRVPFYVEGCALMISKADFVKLGRFDETYYVYSEDIDLCWRALISGMKVEVCNSAELYHYGGGSSQTTKLCRKRIHVVPYFRRYEVEKNNLRNLLKNYSLINLLWTFPGYVLISFFEAIFYLVIGNAKAATLIGKAILWNITNISDTLKERRRLQESRVTGDYEIMKKMSNGLIPNKLRGLLTVGIPKFK